ncbi:MFS transporter [Halioxenophilus sp. WMMB6]|uniref:MFS transporter n=1 Tax=Halioxenophilus sp. WMMB6 TaxID=3073815 RepID=UPI00295ECFEF|nr:MFS transporter [Halioxenophilus sp. WMMB6]
MQRTFYPGWWQVAIALLMQAVAAASVFTAYSIIAVPLKAEFQPSNMVLMFGLTITSLASGILSPLLGSAIDRYSIRSLMMVGAGLISCGFFALSFAGSMNQVVIIYGLCMAPATVLLGPIAGSALLSRWFTQRRGLALGIAASGGAVGGLILPPLMQTLMGGFDWRIALKIYSGLLFLITCPTILLFVVDRPEKINVQVEGATISTEPKSAIARTAKLTSQDILLHPTFWVIALILGTLFAGPMAVVSNMMQLADTKGIAAVEAAFLISVLSGANFGGKLICAAIIDRASLRVVLAVMLSALGLSMLGMQQAHNYPLMMAMALLGGLASGGAVPVWSLVLSRVYGPARIGQVMGVMTFVIMPFTLLSPPIFGRVFDQTGSYDFAFFGYLALLLFTLMWLTRLRVTPLQRGEAELAPQSNPT